MSMDTSYNSPNIKHYKNKHRTQLQIGEESKINDETSNNMNMIFDDKSKASVRDSDGLESLRDLVNKKSEQILKAKKKR